MVTWGSTGRHLFVLAGFAFALACATPGDDAAADEADAEHEAGDTSNSDDGSDDSSETSASDTDSGESETGSSSTDEAGETETETDTDASSDTDGDSGEPQPQLPSELLDLTAWKLTLPDASEVKELELAAGFESPSEFYLDEDTGAVVFRCPNHSRSTQNSSYSRTELREMLRAGNTDIPTQGINANNWVFSSSSPENQAAAGGVDGTLTATLTVDHVSTTGASNKVGRVIVGQIHAPEDEPIRLYYRLLPGHARGSIYFAHEAQGGEQWYEMIGSRDDDAEEPDDGIELGEPWAYRIEVEGDELRVTIERDGKDDVVELVSMADSGFADQWMYFKAGVYNQNNSGDEDDYVQASFYSLVHTHP